MKLTEPNTPLNDADHVGSFNFMGFPENWKEFLEIK